MNVTPMRPIDCATFDHHLPWLTNDTLEPGTRAALEQHAARCAHCRAAWDLEKRIAAAIRAEDDEALDDEPSHTAFDRFERRVERPRPARRWRLHAVIIAQAATIAVLAIALVWQWRDAQVATYRTVTNAAAAQSTGHLAILRVALKPQSRSQADEIFARSGVRALTSPSPNAIYTVTPIADSTDAALMSLVELRREPVVLFAEIVQLGGTNRE
jgi:hypothetical protein